MQCTWNAGRHAPRVSLTVVFDEAVRQLRLRPNMNPESGHVGLVITAVGPPGEKGEGAAPLAGHEKTAHSALWREGEWVSIALLGAPASAFRIEFMESPSWIALYGVEGEPAPKEGV